MRVYIFLRSSSTGLSLATKTFFYRKFVDFVQSLRELYQSYSLVLTQFTEPVLDDSRDLDFQAELQLDNMPTTVSLEFFKAQLHQDVTPFSEEIVNDALKLDLLVELKIEVET